HFHISINPHPRFFAAINLHPKEKAMPTRSHPEIWLEDDNANLSFWQSRRRERAQGHLDLVRSPRAVLQDVSSQCLSHSFLRKRLRFDFCSCGERNTPK